MTNMGTPIRGRVSLEELLRSALNKILEDEIKDQGIKSSQPIIGITLNETLLLTHVEPTITTTTVATDVYDAATALYESSEYA